MARIMVVDDEEGIRKILAQVLEYSKTRELFGRPLAANQAIQIRLAEMARRITTAQLLSMQLGRAMLYEGADFGFYTLPIHGICAFKIGCDAMGPVG